MRKLLSLILVLAIIASCITVTTFTASAEEEPVHNALKLTSKAVDITHNVSSNGLLNSDSSYNGSKTLVFAIKNIGDTAASPTLSVQGLFNHGGSKGGATWTAPAGTTYENRSTVIQPNTTALVKVTIPNIVNGKLHICNAGCTDTCAEDISINRLWLRFAFTAETTFLINCIASYNGDEPSNDKERVNQYLLSVYSAYKDSADVTYDTGYLGDRNAVKFTLNETVASNSATYGRGKVTFTADMVENGIITKSYDVYNTSDHTVSFNIQYQTSSYSYTGFFVTKWIEAGKKETFTIKIPVTVTEDGIFLDYFKDSDVSTDTPVQLDVNTLYFRCQFNTETAYNVKGSSVIITADDYFDPVYDAQNSGSIKGVELETVPEELSSFAVSADVNPNKAMKLTAKSSAENYSTSALYSVYNAGFTPDPTLSGKDMLVATYDIYNPTDKEIKVNIYFQLGVNKGWTASGYTSSGTITIAPGYKRAFTTKLDVNNGLATGKRDGVTSNKPLNCVLLRIDITVPDGAKEGDSIIIEPTGNTPIFNSIPGYTYTNTPYYSLSYLQEVPSLTYTPTPAPATPAPTIEVSNGDVSEGTKNWDNFHGYEGTVTVTADPEDETNNVIHFEPGHSISNEVVSVGDYTSVFYNFAPAVIQDPYEGLYGKGAGKYYLTFRIKADERILNYPDTAKWFNLTLQSQAHHNKDTVFSQGTLPVNSYLAIKQIYLTSEWQTVYIAFNISTSFLNAIDILKKSEVPDAYKLGFRLDASSSKPYGTPNELFGYYIDDVEINFIEEAKTGISLTAKKNATSNVYARVNAGFTTDDVVNNYITKTYTVYNPTNNPIYFMMQLQGGNTTDHVGWDDLYDVEYMNNEDILREQVVILPKSKHTFEIKAYVNDENKVKFRVSADGSFSWCDINNVFFRFELLYDKDVPAKAGNEIIIQSHNGANDPLFNYSNASYNNEDFFYINELYGDIPYPIYEIENKIEGATLEIGSSLAVNYYATLNDGIENPYINVNKNGYIYKINGISLGNNRYVFPYTGINAQCMSDLLNAELVVNGYSVDFKNHYSVKRYAINTYNDKNSSDDLKALLANMLAYGAEVQKFVNYKTNKLATDGIDWATTNYAKPAGTKNAVQTDPNNRVFSVGLNISYVNKIYFRLSLTDDVTIKVTKGEEVINFTREGNLVYTDEIIATSFNDIYTITLTKGEKVISTVNYNVNAYLNAKYDSVVAGGETTVGAIVKALNNYGAAARVYGNLD